MDLEEQILHYYLKIFSIFLIFFLFFISLFIFNSFNKNLILIKNPINIEKGENLEEILNKNIYNLTLFDVELIKIYFKINNYIFRNFIHYGEFDIEKNSNLLDLFNVITKPSNVLNSITIVEGWSKKQLHLELSKHFKNFQSIPYQNLIADTYYFQKILILSLFVKNLVILKIIILINIKIINC